MRRSGTLSVLCFAAALLVALALAGCCKPNQPPSFLCKLQERSLDCAREIGAGAAAQLGAQVLAALRGGASWESALQSLVDTAGDAAICVIGNLPKVFEGKPAAGPAELAQRKADLERARAFLSRRGLKVSAAPASP